MARQRSPNRDKAFEIWEASGRKVMLKDIAAQLGVSESQIRKWKNQDQWEKVTLPKEKSNVTKRKKGGQPNNQNAKGNSGGAAPLGNKNAEKHGFFSKWLPQETLEIVQEIREMTPLDMLYDQIELQYAGIIRAQKLMYVKDKQDVTIAVTSQSDMGTSYDVQQAWDKHERFLNAQSRAMTALNSLIKQYEDMLRHEEEKGDIAEERRQRIAKIKAETKRINEEKQDNKNTTINVIMGGEVAEYAE